MGFLCKFVGNTTHYGHLHAVVFILIFSLSFLRTLALPQWLVLSMPSPLLLKCKSKKNHNDTTFKGFIRPKDPNPSIYIIRSIFIQNILYLVFFLSICMNNYDEFFFLGVFFHHTQKKSLNICRHTQAYTHVKATEVTEQRQQFRQQHKWMTHHIKSGCQNRWAIMSFNTKCVDKNWMCVYKIIVFLFLPLALLCSSFCLFLWHV